MLIDSVLRPNYALSFEPPFPEWLFMTIRGILDSFYFEILSKDFSVNSNFSLKFVDFVY